MAYATYANVWHIQFKEQIRISANAIYVESVNITC
jgi:hypothetical protein